MRKIITLTIAILLLSTAAVILVSSLSKVTDISIAPLSPQLQETEPAFPAGENGYLIIAPGNILQTPAIGKFIEHKRSLGFKVQASSIEEIAADAQAGELADRIRRHIIDNAGKLGLRFVLLIGDPEPADIRIKLPVEEDVPSYMVSAPSRSMGGTYAYDTPDGEITSSGKNRLVILSGPNLQLLQPGEMKYWYVNCTSPGKIRMLILRKENGAFRKIFSSEMRDVKKPGIAFSTTAPAMLKAGDYIAFELPAEGAAKVAAAATPGVASAVFSDSLPGEPDLVDEASLTERLESVPLIQCSVYFEPEDTIGSVPSKMCWPMSTYNGVYSSLLRDSCLSQCPTDAYYANISGNWDTNENGFFGETFQKFFRYDHGADAGALSRGDFRGHGDSFMPELLVGRIPFDDADTVSSIIEKTIAYETSKDIEWRRKCLLGADPLAPDTDNYALCELLSKNVCRPEGFEATRFYTEFDFDGEVQSPGKYNYKPEILVSLEELGGNKMAGYDRFSKAWVTRQPGLVLWSSHANTDICRNMITLRDQSGEKYPQPVTRVYVDALDESHPAIVFAASCSLTQQEKYYLGTRKKRTRLEHNWEPRPNIGRELIKKGAVAVIGPSRSIWFSHGWNSPDDGGCLTIAYDFAKRLIGGESVGYSLAAALRDYCTLHGSELADGENAIGFMIYGDPSISLGLDKKTSYHLARPKRMPGLTVQATAAAGEKIDINIEGNPSLELESGTPNEARTMRAGAESNEEWFSYNGFGPSEKRACSGERSYYSGTARHSQSTLTLDMPLQPGQDFKLFFECWYVTEPGLDYVFFEKSPDGIRWETIDMFTGTSSAQPLFLFNNPGWTRKEYDLCTHHGPAYLRFRYVTNDSYKKEPHEGFYMDNFTLLPKDDGGKVGYFSGWQRVKRSAEGGPFRFMPAGEGRHYVRAFIHAKAGRQYMGLYCIDVSNPRKQSWRELIRTGTGATGLIIGLVGLFFLLVTVVIPNKNTPAKNQD